jgi:hypothetical protein
VICLHAMVWVVNIITTSSLIKIDKILRLGLIDK